MSVNRGAAATGKVIPLPGLEGKNPLGFLAALGVLDACSRGEPAARLEWTTELTPTAVLICPGGLDRVLDLADADRAQLVDDPVLTGPSSSPLTDAKPPLPVLRTWALQVEKSSAAPRSDATAGEDLLTALVAEQASDSSSRTNAKPTHLHFSAGQQQFLRLANDLARSVDRTQLEHALTGPWVPDLAAKTFGWNAGGERVFAFRATDPSGEKRPGYPGPDWLAFRGLACLPVVAREATGGFTLVTTACETGWKVSSFRWPLWSAPLGVDEARSLIGAIVPQPRRREELGPAAELAARGITWVLRSPISRSDQGGYGSFGAADTEMDATSADTGL